MKCKECETGVICVDHWTQKAENLGARLAGVPSTEDAADHDEDQETEALGIIEEP